MSGALSAGRRRRKRRLRQRSAREEDADQLELAMPLEVEVHEAAWYERGQRSSKLAAAAAVSAATSTAEVSRGGPGSGERRRAIMRGTLGEQKSAQAQGIGLAVVRCFDNCVLGRC